MSWTMETGFSNFRLIYRLSAAILMPMLAVTLLLTAGRQRTSQAVACHPQTGVIPTGTLWPPETYTVYVPISVRNYPPPPQLPPVPIYRLYVSPNYLDWLAQQPYRNETVPATFCASSSSGSGERCWEVRLRYRGDTARIMPKKSWKIFFPTSDPFYGQLGVSYEMNLNADYVDQSLLRTYIGYDLFTRAGVIAPRSGYVRLYINDSYYGLFSEVEQIDERFLQRHGIEMHGNLYKPFYGRLGLEENDWWYNYHYPKKTNRNSGHQDLVAFIELINRTPDEQFPTAIASVMDVNGWLEWYAVNILIGNFEMTNKNYYIYHDFSTDRWMILPWDVDISFGHNEGKPWGLWDRDISWDNPIDTGADPASKHNYLIERMMRVPEFRLYHCRRLIELMAAQFSPAEMFPRIDATYEYIYEAAMADPNRWRPELEGYPGFQDGPAELKTYITNRIQFLQQRVPSFCPSLRPLLAINELMVANSTTITDEAGEPAPWIEIHNHSSTLAWDISGMYLTDVLSEPRKWSIPAGTVIPPDGALLLWADGEPDEGLYHTNFTLRESGGQIGLFDRDVFGNAPVSLVTYTAPVTDVSYGRMPDGSESWQFLTRPSPGRPNLGLPPIFGRTVHSPAWPTAGTPVTITTIITDEGNFTVTLWYRTFTPGQLRPGYTSRVMSGAGETRQAVLPLLPEGTWVEYYLEAVDETGKRSLDRPGWPQWDYRYIVGWRPLPLYINEVMAINNRTLADEQGDYDDWIELYNAGSTPLDVGGMYLSDNLDNATPYMIPYGTVIPAGGYLILWADGSGTGLHPNFNLSGAGEYVGLFDRQSRFYAPVDAVYFDPLTPDVSWGRVPDGAPEQFVLAVPSPGGPNSLPPPTFSQVMQIPRWPEGGEAVTVSAVVVSGAPVVSVTLWYAVGNQYQPVDMRPAGENTYVASIPPFDEGVLVYYYLRAEDRAGHYSLHPPDAPTSTIRYLVGYTPPQLFINEFLASNTAVNRDEAGEYDDWVELYNAGPLTVSLSMMYLSDSLADPTEWQFPAGTVIPPGGFLLVWCDNDVGQGPLHANFKLDRTGEEIGLFERTSYGLVLPVDWVVFGPQQKNISYGRWPDGAAEWRFFNFPTPGAGN